MAKLWIGTSTPGDANVAANYSPAAVPVNGDDLYIQNTSQGISASLSALSAVTLANLFINSAFTGQIGSASADFQISFTNGRIGDASGSATGGAGSNRIRLDAGSNPFTLTVLATGNNSADTGLEPLRIKGSNAANQLLVLGGRVGFATSLPSDTGTLASFSVSGSGTLNLGSGTTWTAGYQTGSSTVTINSGGSTFTQESGTATLQGSGVVATIVCGGTMALNQRPGYQAPTGITRTSGAATVTFSGAHGYVTGDTVYVTGANEQNYNGFQTVTGAPATNTFTYAISTVAPTPATGAAFATLKAIASLTTIDGGTADFSADSRDVAVAVLTMNPNSNVKVNQARPGHLIIGSLVKSNVSELSAE